MRIKLSRVETFFLATNQLQKEFKRHKSNSYKSTYLKTKLPPLLFLNNSPTSKSNSFFFIIINHMLSPFAPCCLITTSGLFFFFYCSSSSYPLIQPHHSSSVQKSKPHPPKKYIKSKTNRNKSNHQHDHCSPPSGAIKQVASILPDELRRRRRLLVPGLHPHLQHLLV